MQVNRLRYTIIQSVINRGISDIRDNPERGIRNMVDLGAMHATGHFQQEFFQQAQEELENKNTSYYEMIEHIANSVDEQNLSSFGINLGYRCWSVGARQIRDIEKKNGYNVPWTLIINPGTEGIYVGGQAIADLIRQGRKLGIYCYIFYLEEDYANLDDLLVLLNDFPDCAFVLLLQAAMIRPDNIEYIHAVSNVFVGVDVSSRCGDTIPTALSLLAERRCFYGGFTVYDSKDDSFDAQSALQKASEADMPVLIFAQQDFITGDKRSRVNVKKLRQNIQYPVFPLDMFSDIALADRNISSEGCIAFIDASGYLTLVNDDTQTVCYSHNVAAMPLQDIFQEALPKEQTDAKQKNGSLQGPQYIKDSY